MATGPQSRLQEIPADLISLAGYEAYARDIIDPATLAYINGGSGSEAALKANRRDFDALQIYNRILVDCRNGSTSTTLLGQTLRHPVLLAPVGYHRLAHPDGELATAKGSLDTVFVASTLSSVALEQIPPAAAGPCWFQLYFQHDRAATLRLLRRAEASGYAALMVTLDTPIQPQSHAARQAGFRMPAGVFAANLADAPPPPKITVQETDSLIFQGMMAEAPGWDDLKWLREETRLPLLVKGVSHPADAEMLIHLGVDGLVLSNHGGRALEAAPSALRTLGPIRAAVGPKVTLLMDGGIRSGSDVFKALACGANAVMIGRPQLYALAVAGSLGVAHMLRLLREELEVTMALAGCPTIDSITADALFAPHV